MLPSSILKRALLFAFLSGSSLLASSPMHMLKPNQKTSEQLRQEYITRLQQKYVPAVDQATIGSLWSPQGLLNDLNADYKAHNLNDTITILVSVQTTAAQSGSVATQRTFSTNSSINSVLGHTPFATNPLLAANSSSALKGSGATASNTTFATTLTGQVIAVLPSGALVVEAERQIYMNNQHENVIVRGMIRPGDIGSSNTVPSTALSNLEIEMKGKGIISDGVKPPNALTRAVLWLLNF
ncbi:MAG: flagellar basal body L-ring protein FlgH [Acidobacteriaceae bacterium]